MLGAINQLANPLNEAEGCHKTKLRNMECLQVESKDRIKKEEDLNSNIAKIVEKHVTMFESLKSDVEFSTQTIGLFKEEGKELREKLDMEQNVKSELESKRPTI